MSPCRTDFLVRRAAGNVVELLGIAAFRASPVWQLAALADVCGMGRHLIPEIADALKVSRPPGQGCGIRERRRAAGRPGAHISAGGQHVQHSAAGCGGASERVGRAFKRRPARLQPASLPSRETIGRLWLELKSESEKQNRSVFETSSMMAVSAVRSVPDGLRWLSASTKVEGKCTGTGVRGDVAGSLSRDTARDPADGLWALCGPAPASLCARSDWPVLTEAPNANRAGRSTKPRPPRGRWSDDSSAGRDRGRATAESIPGRSRKLFRASSSESNAWMKVASCVTLSATPECLWRPDTA